MPKVSVVIPIYNNERSVEALIESLRNQSHPPEEIIVVDDGSTDRSEEILRAEAERGRIRYFRKENGGAASARNIGWKMAVAPICAFTDGDCLPDRDWLEHLTAPFADSQVAGVGGTYRTLNDESSLARFIGLELEFRYHQVEGRVDCHGTYNLAVRRELMEQLGGFNEDFRTSAEDWDFTYRLSANHLLIFNRRAVVGHFHPEKLAKYLALQQVRALDRMRLYRKHPAKTSGDSYTEKAIGWRLMASAVMPLGLLTILLVGPSLPLLLIPIFLLMAGVDGRLFIYLWRKRGAFAFYGLTVQYLRNFAWLTGIARFYANGGGLRAGKSRRLESGS